MKHCVLVRDAFMKVARKIDVTGGGRQLSARATPPPHSAKHHSPAEHSSTSPFSSLSPPEGSSQDIDYKVVSVVSSEYYGSDYDAPHFANTNFVSLQPPDHESNINVHNREVAVLPATDSRPSGNNSRGEHDDGRRTATRLLGTVSRLPTMMMMNGTERTFRRASVHDTGFITSSLLGHIRRISTSLLGGRGNFTAPVPSASEENFPQPTRLLLGTPRERPKAFINALNAR